jgi:DNA-binding SARP family transcriptional activator
MGPYCKKGKTNQKLQTYVKLKQVLKSEIQCKPEELTNELYNKILNMERFPSIVTWN